MKKRLQVNAFVRFIMRVSILQIFLIGGIISMTYASDLVAQEILERKLSIQFDHINLRAALSKIEKETGAKFLYHSQLIPKEKVTLHLLDETLEQVLGKILLPLGINYEADGKYIILSRKKSKEHAEEASLANPEMDEALTRIIGKITDESDAPIPGVNVIVKGTTNGTSTDSDGNYIISVNDANDILVYSFIGYGTQEVAVGSQTTINIKMIADLKTLDEVVIVGYGEQKKSSLTAAIGTFKGEDVVSKPVVNLSNNLAGRIAGLIVTQGSGEPGNDGATINIRGIATNGNNSPLLVVDGIYRDFTKLDPTTIESYTVLKDAAAVAPYGLAGANGVILVTTKKGKSGTPTFSYNSYVAFQNPTRATPLVNSYEYALMRNEAAQNEGNPPVFSDAELAGYKKTVDDAPDADRDLYPNSNGLKDVIKKNTMITYHNLELSGGSDKIKYYTALGFTSQQGQWTTTHLRKYNLLANIEAQATKTTTVALKLNGWIQDEYYPGHSAGDLMYQAFRTPPTSAIYYSNGTWGQYVGRSLIGQMYHSGHDFYETTTIMTNFSIEQKIPFIEGLSVKGQASYDPTYRFDKEWHTPVPVYTLNTSITPYTFDLGYQGASKPSLQQNYSLNKAFTYQGYLNYQHSFGKHDVTLLGVIESRNQKYNSMGATIINYSANIDELNTGSSAKADYSITGTSSQQQQIGYVYRASYSYANKYMAEVAGRYDGHFAFAPGHKYSFFPSYSVGWNLGEENFIKDNFKSLDMLKVRASYGKSGNLPSIGGSLASFQYLSSYQLYGGSYKFGNTPNQGLSETLQGNPNITWEKSTKYDVGLEASFMNGRLTLEADYFAEHRTGMLMSQGNSVPLEYGVPLGLANIGIMNNHGIEITLGASHTFDNGIRVMFNGNFTYAKNKMVQILETDATYNNPNRRRTGRPLNTQFGYKALGYFTANDFNPDGSLKEGIPVQPWGAVHPGDLRYADLSGPDGKPDGLIDSNDETVIGHPKTPQIMFGLMPNISYKGFDLDLLFQGAGQANLYLGGVVAQPFDFSASATKLQFQDHWTPANTNAAYPRLTGAPTTNNSQGSSWWIRDGRYVRLKSMQFGYTFPTSIINRLKVVKSLRFYISGQNLFTWTPKMKEIIDPEAGDANGQYYFQQRVISIGTNIKF